MTITELEHCIDLYGRDIYSFCRHATGSIQEGEELYQDTFLKAVELLDKMDMNQNPKSFLLSIAIRLWKNKRRKFAWRQRIVGMESLEEKEEYQNIPSNIDSTLPEKICFKGSKSKWFVNVLESFHKNIRFFYIYIMHPSFR